MSLTNSKMKITNDFNKIVLERRSVKVYDSEVKISREEIGEILAKASRAPSAINMQPWRFLVIDSDEGKKSWLNSHLSMRQKFLLLQLSLQYFMMQITWNI